MNFVINSLCQLINVSLVVMSWSGFLHLQTELTGDAVLEEVEKTIRPKSYKVPEHLNIKV